MTHNYQKALDRFSKYIAGDSNPKYKNHFVNDDCHYVIFVPDEAFAIKSALELAVKMQIRDMSTAPKDGQTILGYYYKYKEYTPIFYHDGKDNYWNYAGFYDECDTYNILTAKPMQYDGWLPLDALPTPPQEER